MKIIALIILLIILYSCEEREFRYPVAAGKYNTHYLYTEYKPSIQLDLRIDSISGCYFGRDSIDIDMDGNYDLIIDQKHAIEEGSKDCLGENFPHVSITLKNDLELVEKIEYYSMGHGAVGSSYWVNALEYDTRIENCRDWSLLKKKSLLWATPQGYTGYGGFWRGLEDTERYIGIRKKVESDYKYGWIKIYQSNYKRFEIKSCAIQK